MKTISFKRKLLWIVVIIIVICFAVGVVCQYEYKRTIHLRFAAQMGNGINLGNTLDATNLRDYHPESGDLEYETFWGNPRITRDQLAAIKSAGFGTVRIPITLEDHLDANNKIATVWLERISEVIRMALDEDLYVIMDLHGDEWLNLQLDRKEEIREKFAKVWTQLAVELKDCDDHLIFEGMNEPRLRDSDYEWKSGTEELKDFVNELNLLFVETVRQTGGNNEERYLMICPYCNIPQKENCESLIVPDGNIMIAVHMYRPYGFCQDREGTYEWDETNSEDTQEAKNSFSTMYKCFVRQGTPVIFTEYGCVDKNNTDERIEWASYYMSLSRKYRISCIWWDNGSSYQLMNREENTWKYPRLVEIITGKE